MELEDCVTSEDFARMRMLNERPWEDVGQTLPVWLSLREHMHSPELITQPYHPFARLLPQEPGIYFLFTVGNKLLYIGQSVDLAVRVLSHWKRSGFEFGRVAWIEAPKGALSMLEVYLIADFDPPMNKKFCVHMQAMEEELSAAIMRLKHGPPCPPWIRDAQNAAAAMADSTAGE